MIGVCIMEHFEHLEEFPYILKGRMNSFITTSFDDSMTVEMQMRILIEWIKKNIDLTNSQTTYLNSFIENFDNDLHKTTNDVLNSWVESGEFDDLLNKGQLAKKADKSFVDAKFSAIVSGSPKGTFNTLSELKTTYPNGTEGVFLTLNNGHWYYYVNEWLDGGIYQEMGIADGTVNEKKLTDGLQDKIANIPMNVENVTSYVIVDENGKKSDIELDMNGNIADRVIQKWSERLDTPQQVATNISYAVIDENGKTSDIELNENGQFSDRVIDSISRRLNINTSNSSSVKIYCYGESTTEGGSSGKSYPQVLQERIGTGSTVINHGVSGRTSGDVAILQGGAILTMTADSPITIDKTTNISQEVTFSIEPNFPKNLRYANFYYEKQKYKLNFTNRENFKGTISLATANTSSDVVLPSTIKSEPISDDNQFFTNIYWISRNDTAFSWPTIDNGSLANLNAMIEFQKEKVDFPKFLILSIINMTNEPKDSSGYNLVKQLNDGFRNAYPENYVDVRSYLIKNGLKETGITATQKDLDNIANDIVPDSLMADTTHPNAQARTVIAKQIYFELLKRGWI